MRIVFDVKHSGEQSAGINGYTDTVIIEVESPGGDEGEFMYYMRDCLAVWFDGAKVTPNGQLQGPGGSLPGPAASDS